MISSGSATVSCSGTPGGNGIIPRVARDEVGRSGDAPVGGQRRRHRRACDLLQLPQPVLGVGSGSRQRLLRANRPAPGYEGGGEAEGVSPDALHGQYGHLLGLSAPRAVQVSDGPEVAPHAAVVPVLIPRNEIPRSQLPGGGPVTAGSAYLSTRRACRPRISWSRRPTHRSSQRRSVQQGPPVSGLGQRERRRVRGQGPGFATRRCSVGVSCRGEEVQPRIEAHFLACEADQALGQ